jgi:replicative DNA helicase
MADGSQPVPRNDLDAEGSLLGAAMVDQGVALDVLELLEEADYYADANRLIHRAIRELSARGDQADLVSVRGWLESMNLLTRVGGSSYLVQLIHGPSLIGVHVEQAARAVRGWARIRAAQLTFTKLAGEARIAEIPDVDAWLEQAEMQAYQATSNHATKKDTTSTYADVGPILDACWAEARANKERTWGTATGFARLDEHTLGMQPGQFWVVGARPGQGKTSFGQQLAEYVAERGGGEAGVIFLSAEMSSEELAFRTAARHSLQSARAIQKGKLDNTGWHAVVEARKRVSNWPILIDDEKRLTPLKIRNKVLRHQAALRKRYPNARLRLVLLDYLQLFHADVEKRNGTRAGELGEITRALKVMAGEFDCPFLALSQLTRPPDKSKMPPPPTLFDFRDSGSIEADGDVVIGLHRPDQYGHAKPGYTPTGVCEVHVLKGRGCGECAFELSYTGRSTRFDNIDERSDQLWKPEDA